MKLPKSSPRRKMKTPKPKPKRGDLNESMSSNEKMKPVNLKDGGAVCSGSGSAMQGTKFRGVR
tara:strand:- start:14 stop:202 length:189 start_codon:yes stop_codon:yes gene_type:complete